MTSATIEATDAPVALEIKAVEGRQDAPLEALGEWGPSRLAFTRRVPGVPSSR